MHVVVWYQVIILAMICNIPVGYFAYKKRSLTQPYGLITAGFVGAITFLAHPLYWIMLLAFFGSSTILTRYKNTNKLKENALKLAEKGGQRDSKQVLANGGIALIISSYSIIKWGFWYDNLNTSIAFMITISFAVTNSDTWATEIGVLSKRKPIWILNPLKTVPNGTSGGISVLGIGASISGAAFIGLIYSISLTLTTSLHVLFIITIAGLTGSLIDSLLGATIQCMYHCTVCDKITEKNYHKDCSSECTYKKGVKFINNDLVNILSVIFTLIIFNNFILYLFI